MARRPDLFARFDESKLTTKAEKRILQQAREEFRALSESVPAPAASGAAESSTQDYHEE